MAKKRGKRSKAKVDTSRTGKLPWSEPAAVIEDDATPSPVAMSIGETRDDAGAGEDGTDAAADAKAPETSPADAVAEAKEPAAGRGSRSLDAPPPEAAAESKEPAAEAAAAPPAEAAAEAKDPAAPEAPADDGARASDAPAAAVAAAEVQHGEKPAAPRAESDHPDAGPTGASPAGPRKKARAKGKKERAGEAASTARERTSGDLDHAFFRAEDRISHAGIEEEDHAALDPLHARAADPGFAARRAQLRRVVMIAVAAAALLSIVPISRMLTAPPAPAPAAQPEAVQAPVERAAPEALGNARQAAPAAPEASGSAGAAPSASAAAAPAAPAPPGDGP